MALVPNLNALKAEEDAIATARAEINTRRQAISDSRTSQGALLQAIEQDLRDANTNGIGVIFTVGYLDAVPDGTIATISRNDATRRLTFKYDKDNDTIFDIVYETGNFEVGGL